MDAVRQANYLKDIAVEVRQQYPHLLGKVNNTTLMANLKHAHASALQFGLTETASISHFLYFSIVYPKFYERQGFIQWMKRPFDTPEQRFRDFYHVTLFTLDVSV